MIYTVWLDKALQAKDQKTLHYSRVKYLHGIPWKSMEFHKTPMEHPWSIHGVPWNAMEFHGVPWNAMEFHGVSMEIHGMPWSSTEFHEVVMEFHGMP